LYDDPLVWWGNLLHLVISYALKSHIELQWIHFLVGKCPSVAHIFVQGFRPLTFDMSATDATLKKRSSKPISGHKTIFSLDCTLMLLVSKLPIELNHLTKNSKVRESDTEFV
jgi:hypothetical protein